MIQWKNLSRPPTQVINFIIHERDICRMCFKNADASFSSVFDTLHIDSDYFTATITIDSLFNSFSTNQNKSHELPCQICTPCTKRLIEHFSFVQECKVRESYWQTVAERIYNKQQETHSKLKSSVYLDLFHPIISDVRSQLDFDSIHYKKPVKGAAGPRTDPPVIERYVVKDGKYICDICTREWASEFKLKKHRRSHFHENLECERCGVLFKNRNSIRKHLKLTCKAEPDGIYECDECHLVFKSQEAIDRHKKYACKNLKPIEQALNTRACEWCNKAFKNKMAVKRHRIICKKRDKSFMESQEQFICDECGEVQYSKNLVLRHIRSVHAPKNVPCDVCGKLFKSTTQVRYHMQVHTKEKPFQCEFCEKFFVARNALAYHRRLHTGERPYPCSLCEERFLSASRRMAHMRQKHWGRQYECEYCHSKFISNAALTKHRNRHFKPNTKLERVFLDSTKQWSFVDADE